MKLTRRQLRKIINTTIKESNSTTLINENWKAKAAKVAMHAKIKAAFDDAGVPGGEKYAKQLVKAMEEAGFDEKLEYGTRSAFGLAKDTETVERLTNGPLKFHPQEIVDGTKDLEVVGNEVVEILTDTGYMGEPPDIDDYYEEQPGTFPGSTGGSRTKKTPKKESDFSAAWEALAFIIDSKFDQMRKVAKKQAKDQYDYVDSNQGFGASRWR